MLWSNTFSSIHSGLNRSVASEIWRHRWFLYYTKQIKHFNGLRCMSYLILKALHVITRTLSNNHATEFFFILSAQTENSFGWNRDVLMSSNGVGRFRIWLLLCFPKINGKSMLLTTFTHERVDLIAWWAVLCPQIFGCTFYIVSAYAV